MERKLQSFLNYFFNLEIAAHRVRIPYWRNRFLVNGKRIQGPFGGKGIPGQIRSITLKKAKQKKISLKRMSSEEVHAFMRSQKIGLDCSGFVFQVLAFLKPKFWKKLQWGSGKSLNPIRRFSAADLTSERNSKSILKTGEIRKGDLIALSLDNKSGKIDHILIVVDVSPKKIIYAHSSTKTKVTGPHLGEIKIANPDLALEKQNWQEKELAIGDKTIKVRRIAG